AHRGGAAQQSASADADAARPLRAAVAGLLHLVDLAVAVIVAAVALQRLRLHAPDAGELVARVGHAALGDVLAHAVQARGDPRPADADVQAAGPAQVGEHVVDRPVAVVVLAVAGLGEALRL